MNKFYTFLAAILLTISTFAQAPEKMSYQAVVRDAGNALLTDQAVGMQISILQGSASGTAVYVETQTPNTNINGLVSIEIGSGTVVNGAFNTVDWSDGPYFIKTETDPAGGINYTITGTSQLMSVPYALHANTADSVVGGKTPAMFATASIWPPAAVMAGAKAASSDSRFRTSALTQCKFADSIPGLSETSTAITCQSRSRYSSAVARPIPLPAPVITAVPMNTPKLSTIYNSEQYADYARGSRPFGKSLDLAATSTKLIYSAQ